MSEEPELTNYKLISRFIMATNVEEMHHRLEAGLLRLSENKISFSKLYIPRVFPRKDGSLSIQYSLQLRTSNNAGTKQLILCGALLNSSSDAQALASSWGNNLLFFKDLCLVIPLFPYDPTLSMLAQLEDNDSVPEFLNKWLSTKLSGDEKPLECDKRILGYRLEKRCTLACSVTVFNSSSNERRSIKVIAKLLTPKKTEKLEQRLAHVRQHWNTSDESVKLLIPEIYEIDTTSGLVLMELLPGKSIHDLSGSESLLPACHAAGLLLKKLHSIPGFSGANRSREREFETIQRWIDLVSPLREDSPESFNAIIDKLKSIAMESDSQYEESCLHGDFYDKQVLYGAEAASLIDFDNLGRGDPAVDLGNFLAHLDLRNLQHPDEVETLKMGAKAFCDSYGISNEDFHNRIKWWQCAALIRLAAVYTLRPHWQHLPRLLLANANKLCTDLTEKQRKAEIN